jgi:HEAT repeat protein
MIGSIEGAGMEGDFQKPYRGRDEALRIAALMRERKLTAKQTSEAINNFSRIPWEFVRPVIERELDNPDCIVRIESLNALGFAFSSTSRLDRVIELFKSDEDDDVRCAAAYALGTLCEDGKHPEIRMVFVATIRDPDESAFLRVSAYRGLLNANGTPKGERPPLLADAQDLSIINWDIVR